MMKKVQFTDVIDLVTVTGGCMLGDKQEREQYQCFKSLDSAVDYNRRSSQSPDLNPIQHFWGTED